jgi:hypothetical protein
MADSRSCAPAQKVRELWEELRSVLSGRSDLIDSVIPAAVFVIVNGVADLRYAVWSAVGLGAALAVYRIVRRDSVRYALTGLGAAAIASAVALLLGRAEGYFLPAIVTGVTTVVLCIVSVMIRRPLVAWTSHLARRWPRDWYWHPRVRPAYSEVTLAWALFFAARVWLQLALLGRQQNAPLGWVSLVMGWPATILLLIVSYLFGTWRLRALGGPSVEEFRNGAPQPWTGQRSGF